MESSHYLIDTSVFVAFYRDIDASHADALRIMGELAEHILIVHPYVIQETATVLASRSGIAVAKRFLEDIAAATNVVIPAVDARYDIGRFIALNKRMSFTDIALVELSRTTGARLITFDKQMLSFFKG